MAANDIRVRVTDSLHTGTAGTGRVELPSGTYLLLDAGRATDLRYKQLLRDHAQPRLYQDAVDKECLGKWLMGPLPCDHDRGE